MDWIKEKEYTIIAGCGRLGATIAGKLSESKKDVLILDSDKTAFRKLSSSYGGLTMLAAATDVEKLEDAGIKGADAFIAVTDNDNVNLCAAQMARKLYRIPKVVARIYDDEKAVLLEGMGVDTICPSELSEKEISHYIGCGGVGYDR